MIARIISWGLEAVLAILFIYGFCKLLDSIEPIGLKLAAMIFALPILSSTWIMICLVIALIRERWLL